MQVKICGITNKTDALHSEKEGAHALGFIFYPGSPRYIEPQKAAEIVDALSVFTTKVGVFVNETADSINAISRETGLTAVQVHGDGNRKMLSGIALPVIRAVRVKDSDSFTNLDINGNESILLDTFSENCYGGTGRPFDWELIPSELRKRIILAGGIGTHNIEDIYINVKPAAIDLSSSLEARPGRKDQDKVSQFFNVLNRIKHEVNNL